MKKRALRLVLSCEHGGNRIPMRYLKFFPSQVARERLHSHRGWDPGALRLARALAHRFDAPLIAETMSRLLIDMNRSEGHRSLFSEETGRLHDRDRAALLALHRAYRAQVRHAVKQHRPALHVSVHSFTPIWQGEERRTDIGLLYDPGRPLERNIALAWREAIAERQTIRRPRGQSRHEMPPYADLCVSRNAPYRGTSDGLTKTLRLEFGNQDYAGLELEVNQRHLRGDSFDPGLCEIIADSLAAVLGSSRQTR